MIESNIRKEVEDKIDDYVQGRLSAEEIDELWAELVQDDYYLDYLKTVAALKKIANEEREREAKIFNLSSAQKWISAAAAILLIVGSITIFNLSTQTSETIQPVASIELDYYRSADGTAVEGEVGGEVVREAITEANQGNVDAAVNLLDSQIAETDNVYDQAEMMITAGSILYNSGRYDEAIERFQFSIQSEVEDEIIRERAYWYLGNTYFQLNELDLAKVAFQNAYELNGAYSRVAQSYIKALSTS